MWTEHGRVRCNFDTVDAYGATAPVSARGGPQREAVGGRLAAVLSVQKPAGTVRAPVHPKSGGRSAMGSAGHRRSSWLRTLVVMSLVVCSMLLLSGVEAKSKSKSRADRLVRAKRTDCEK